MRAEPAGRPRRMVPDTVCLCWFLPAEAAPLICLSAIQPNLCSLSPARAFIIADRKKLPFEWKRRSPCRAPEAEHVRGALALLQQESLSLFDLDVVGAPAAWQASEHRHQTRPSPGAESSELQGRGKKGNGKQENCSRGVRTCHRLMGMI